MAGVSCTTPRGWVILVYNVYLVAMNAVEIIMPIFGKIRIILWYWGRYLSGTIWVVVGVSLRFLALLLVKFLHIHTCRQRQRHYNQYHNFHRPSKNYSPKVWGAVLLRAYYLIRISPVSMKRWCQDRASSKMCGVCTPPAFSLTANARS